MYNVDEILSARDHYNSLCPMGYDIRKLYHIISLSTLFVLLLRYFDPVTCYPLPTDRQLAVVICSVYKSGLWRDSRAG
jgi:hypothetical protein